MKRYNPSEIEPKWQKIWDESKVYAADLGSAKPKYLAMSMFNYPSGNLHIGHAMNYTISDVKARFMRQLGHESYHPVGWDSFGLPAENRAIKAGVSPQASMAELIPDYRHAYKAMGWSNDWSKEISTHEPEYYKWTQWIFSQMFKNGLAYQDARMQWWCEKCQTVLANEQIIDGKCWRHDGADDSTVEKKEVKQWFFKITEYADELLEAIEDLDWTESVKLAQKNWIGRSVGAEITFKVCHPALDAGTSETESSEDDTKQDWILDQAEDDGIDITVFTTRPDTLFGATFLVLAPESDIVAKITKASQKEEVGTYVKVAAKKSEIERQANKEKTGVFTGTYAINPINNEKIPIWVADYVLTGYGTGAIMAVPAHDERDNDFAKKYQLPIIEVVAPDFGIPLNDAVDVTGPVVIGFDPETKEFMSLINTKNNMRWLASGGLNEGEDYEAAALRELAEEAGYKNVKKLIQLGGPTYSYYFNSNKNSNRRSFSYMYLAVIDKNEQSEQALESHEQYQVAWSSIEEITADFLKEPDGRGHWIDGMARAKEAAECFLAGKPYQGPIFTGDGVIFNSASSSGNSLRMIDENNPHREGKELVERNVVTCVVKHPSEDKYIIARPTKGGPWSPLMGGIDDGESPVDAAKRELAEETGYVDIGLVKSRGDVFTSEFFAVHKDVNRVAYCNIIYIELASLNIDESLATETDQQEIKWVTEAEYKQLPNNGGVHHVFDVATSKNKMISNRSYDGMASSDAREKIVVDLKKAGQATEKVNYKMRDWSVSRQRYWGAPIPIVNCEKCGTVLVPDEQLPVVLPELTDFQPSGDGRSALARATEWLKTTCPDCGGEAERETDTLDTYICSSWYMYRYLDPENTEQIFNSETVNKWMPVDFYNGGDHATAHLLYARFVARFFTKIGIAKNPEPFKQMLFNGKVAASDGSAFSKSKGNGIDPLEIINSGYGADALRTYLMFAAPLEFSARWDSQGVPGTHRFLSRLWNLVQSYLESDEVTLTQEQQKTLKRASATTVKKVTEDIEANRYNTAIAATMAGLNVLYKLKNDHFGVSPEWKSSLETLVACVAPFAPHVAEELWQQLGNDTSVHKDSWPELHLGDLELSEVKLVVQVNGKVRSTIVVASDTNEADAVNLAKSDEKVASYLGDNALKKTIFVPNKLINFVI